METNKEGSNAMATLNFNGAEKRMVLRFTQFSEPTDDQLKNVPPAQEKFTGYFNQDQPPQF